MRTADLDDGIMLPASDPELGGAHRRVELPGSRILSIRAVREADAPGLIALYAALSEDDLYRRFFTAHAPPERFVEKMTKAEERGGFGLVAAIDEPDDTSRIVGEAGYEPIGDGNGEFGITVAEDSRGWIGPYLLDALVEEAAARGVQNLEAEVLVENRPMLSLLNSRGFAVLDQYAQPAIVRVAIGTTNRVPSWPGSHDRQRILLEVPGGHWHADEAARKAGFQVLACPGPRRGWSQCPALRGEPCPLVAGADLIVDAMPGEPGRALLDAHRRMYPSVPVCVELRSEGSEVADLGVSASQIPSKADDAMVIGILQRMATAIPDVSEHEEEGPN